MIIISSVIIIAIIIIIIFFVLTIFSINTIQSGIGILVSACHMGDTIKCLTPQFGEVIRNADPQSSDDGYILS